MNCLKSISGILICQNHFGVTHLKSFCASFVFLERVQIIWFVRSVGMGWGWWNRGPLSCGCGCGSQELWSCGGFGPPLHLVGAHVVRGWGRSVGWQVVTRGAGWWGGA